MAEETIAVRPEILVITLNIYRVGLAKGNEPKVHIIPDQGEQRIHLVLDETNAVRAQGAQVDLDVQLQREARLVLDSPAINPLMLHLSLNLSWTKGQTDQHDSHDARHLHFVIC